MQNDCDVLLCSGPLQRELDDKIHKRLLGKRHPNILLILTTGGGDPHVAYRVARHLQREYEQVRVFVSGQCKSAGTLLAVCGNVLVVGDRGELGPIDVQLGRTDDLWKSTSGLIESAAVTALENIAWSLFEKFVTETKGLSGGQITFKTAADASAPLVSGMLEPIFAQIDPLKLGENTRALNIAREYALRLDKQPDNLEPGESLEKLVSGYPDHGFVIDRKEAQDLFRRVEPPTEDLRELVTTLGSFAIRPADRLLLFFLNTEERENKLKNKEEAASEEQQNQSVTNGSAEPHPQAASATNGPVAPAAGEQAEH
ncbi:MAG: SppA protein [Chloroflexi bacterium]|nr:SppA protein [Chloroflexota bacterium]